MQPPEHRHWLTACGWRPVVSGRGRQSRPPVVAPRACLTGWIQFLREDTWWDVHAGRELPSVQYFVGASVNVWACLGDDLSQSNWATSTRRLYQGWLSAFLIFCEYCGVAPLPVDPSVLRDWLTRLTSSFAYGSVQIAASAVIGFCALNNFKNPVVENPAVKIVVDAAKRIKCGVTKAKRAALDAEFVLDAWAVLAELRGVGEDSIVNRRARCIMQVAFEAALRGGEIRHLAVCDLAFVNCGPRCGIECKSHVGSDAYLFLRLHKTSVAGSFKVIRLVCPESPSQVDGEAVSAVHCLTANWLPFLRAQGRTRHPKCDSTFWSKFRCEKCPALFCTFPSESDGIVRPIAVSNVTKMYKKLAVLTGRDPTGFASHSGRIGSFSDATSVDEADEETAARQLGWKGARTPQEHYKRKSASEARQTGLALAHSLKRAARGQPGGQRPRPAQTPVVKLSPVVQTPPPKAAVCTTSRESGKSAIFPLMRKEVGGKPVCVEYQLGICRAESCSKAHVCHGCGTRHPDGSLCRSALRAVTGWRPGN